jgi:hypothetical protein
MKNVRIPHRKEIDLRKRSTTYSTLNFKNDIIATMPQPAS